LAVRREFENRGDAGKRLLTGGHPRDTLSHADAGGQLGSIQSLKFRLVIEQVDM
jgi:hypothetical protein